MCSRGLRRSKGHAQTGEAVGGGAEVAEHGRTGAVGRGKVVEGRGMAGRGTDVSPT